jgi:hypothetical protein
MDEGEGKMCPKLPGGKITDWLKKAAGTTYQSSLPIPLLIECGFLI